MIHVYRVRYLGGAHRSTPCMKRSAHGPLCVAGVVARASGGASAPRSAAQANVLPPRVELKENYPNPFFPATTIPFTISQEVCARGHQPVVSSEDLQCAGPGGRDPGAGRAARRERLDSLRLRCGEYRALLGREVSGWESARRPPGVYYYQLTVDGERFTRKMIAQRRRTTSQPVRGDTRSPLCVVRGCSCHSGRDSGIRHLPVDGVRSEGRNAPNCEMRLLMIRPDRLTIKAQEAFRDAGELARRRGNPVVNDAHLLAGAAGSRPRASCSRCSRRRGSTSPRLTAGGASGRSPASPPRQGGGAEPSFSRELNRVFDRAEAEATKLGDAYVSTEHLLLALAEEKGTTARTLLSAPERLGRRPAHGAAGGARLASGHRPVARGEVPGAGALHPQPDRPGAARESSTRSSAGTRRSAG